jgi:hypothetical protein
MRLCYLIPFAGVIAVALGADRVGQAAQPKLHELAAGSLRFDDWAAQSVYWAVQNHERGGVLHCEAKNEDGTVRKWEIKRILLIDWFRDDGRTSLKYEVRHDGASSDVREVFSHASQAGHRRMLSSAELEQLHIALATLPASSLDPPINYTVLVSFMAGDKWQTAVYDDRKLPDAFEQVLRIVGERFETLGRHEDACHP